MSNKKKLLAEDEDRIREESSDLSLGELLKLEEKLGIKLYQETMSRKKMKIERKFKQEKQQKQGNKNMPHEVSAKIPVSSLREVVKVKKVKTRDPRFDSLCGTFDEKIFKRSYGFISKLRKNDLNALKKELKQATDPKTIKKIKYLIQRLENQLREEKRLKEKEEKKQQEKRQLMASIRRGEKPVFKKKSEKKVLDLVSQYEELKKTGRLKKHIKRLRKKNIHRDRAKLKIDEIE